VTHLYDPHFHLFGGSAGLGFLFDPVGKITHGHWWAVGHAMRLDACCLSAVHDVSFGGSYLQGPP
jgi:hypothetical protein